MSRESDDTLQTVTELRKRLKEAEREANNAQRDHETALKDLAHAEELLRELGQDPSDPRSVKRWMNRESTDIQSLLEKAEVNLKKVAETLGN